MFIKRINTILVLCLLSIVFIVSLFSGCTDKSDQHTGIDFLFTTLDGQTTYLHNFYGKVIVLDLMAVNCQPCMYEMFELKKISENYARDDVVIISLDVWVSLGETSLMLQQYIAAFKQQANVTLDWTFGLDDAQATIAQQYASSGVPTLYIIDTKGNIYYTKVGYEGYATLASKIDELLERS